MISLNGPCRVNLFTAIYVASRENADAAEEITGRAYAYAGDYDGKLSRRAGTAANLLTSPPLPHHRERYPGKNRSFSPFSFARSAALAKLCLSAFRTASNFCGGKKKKYPCPPALPTESSDRTLSGPLQHPLPRGLCDSHHRVERHEIKKKRRHVRIIYILPPWICFPPLRFCCPRARI